MSDLNQLIVELTNSCNAHCVFCPNRLGKRVKTSLDLNLLDKILNEVKGIDTLTNGIPMGLCGIGEPLLHPEFSMVTRMIKGHGVPCGLGSNGELLGRYMEDIIFLDPKEVGFSLDAVTPETHAKMRPGLHFPKIKEALIAYLERLSKGDANPGFLWVQIVVTDLNAHEVTPFVEEWLPRIEGIAGGRVYVKTVCPWPYHEANGLWPTKPYDLPDELRNHSQVLVASMPPPPTYKATCGLFDCFGQVNSDGAYVPCCMPTEDYWGIGNIKDMGILECFHSEKMEALRRESKDNLPFCKDCV